MATVPAIDAGTVGRTEFASSWEQGEPQPSARVVEAENVVCGPADGQPGMGMQVGSGPDIAYTARRHVGFTGVRALGYSGRQVSSGHGRAVGELFSVELDVTETTELSYKVIPADPSDGRELPAPGAFVAVDLEFSDGTRLHHLGATDQHGYALTGAGQGAARVLMANQWNSVRVNVGCVAAGKTITRILLAYERSGDARAFAGWIDDLALTAHPPADERSHPSDWVDTRRGTNSNGLFSRGGTIPAVAVPHGFNFWTPVTDASSRKWPYQFQQHNDADNLPCLQALALSHLDYPWGVDHGTFQVMPTTDPAVPNPDRKARALSFRRADEFARPYHYAVTFIGGLRAEVAPTDHAAVFRFTFRGEDANLVFDNIDGQTEWLRLNPQTGSLTAQTGDGPHRMFVHAIFDRPVVRGGPLQGERGGMGYFRFDVSAGPTVEMRVATSRISAEQARHNLDIEIGADETFETVRNRARDAWDATLGVISDVQGAHREQLTTLYSCLYRMSLYQNSRFENVGTEAEPDYRYAWTPHSGSVARAGVTESVRAGQLIHSTNFWDSYRTTWPALALLYPTKTGRLLDGIVAAYREFGWLGLGMVGTNSDVALADAYLRDVSEMDVEGAYESAVKNATVVSDDQRLGRPGLARSIFLGYAPIADGDVRDGGSSDERAAEALENYLNDFGIANLAKALHARTGEQRYLDEYHYFRNRALGYVFLFDPATGFFQGRTVDGRPRLSPEEYDPKTWGYDYTETNGWGMAFSVPHDGRGLANLLGGREALRAKLDEFFATPERLQDSGSYGAIIHEQREAAYVQIGQWGLSNQPAFHIAHMYHFAGRPDRAQERIREALARLFAGGDIGQGYPGDEDTGSMSAWFVLNALGLYPLVVGAPEFVIGSPLFRSATVNLENGRTIEIKAPRNNPENVYVQAVRINGEPYGRASVPHSVLAQGATIEIDLGPEPSRWATAPSAEPASLTRGAEPATPMRDLTGMAAGVATSSGGGRLDALFDDTSETERELGQNPTVTWEFTDEIPREVQLYTLTSGRTVADPSDWELQASTDGATWVTIDRRSGERFPWRRQTRAFRVTHPGKFVYYRLVVSDAPDARPTGLAQIELIGPI